MSLTQSGFSSANNTQEPLPGKCVGKALSESGKHRLRTTQLSGRLSVGQALDIQQKNGNGLFCSFCALRLSDLGSGQSKMHFRYEKNVCIVAECGRES